MWLSPHFRHEILRESAGMSSLPSSLECWQPHSEGLSLAFCTNLVHTCDSGRSKVCQCTYTDCKGKVTPEQHALSTMDELSTCKSWDCYCNQKITLYIVTIAQKNAHHMKTMVMLMEIFENFLPPKLIIITPPFDSIQQHLISILQSLEGLLCFLISPIFVRMHQHCLPCPLQFKIPAYDI
jgi:hypothetical protein